MHAWQYLGLLGATLTMAYALQPNLDEIQAHPLTSFTQASTKLQSTTAQLQKAIPNGDGSLSLDMQTDHGQRFMVRCDDRTETPPLHLDNWYRVTGTLTSSYLLRAKTLETIASPLGSVTQTLTLEQTPIPLKTFRKTQYYLGLVQGQPVQLIHNHLETPTRFPEGYFTPKGAFQVLRWR